MIDMIMDIASIDTEPMLEAISISDQETIRVPAVDAVLYAKVKQQVLKVWLYDLCSRFDGSCSGSLDAFQWDAEQCLLPSVTLDDIRALHGQSVGRGVLSLLICEGAGCEPYIFVVWEDAR